MHFYIFVSFFLCSFAHVCTRLLNIGFMFMDMNFCEIYALQICFPVCGLPIHFLNDDLSISQFFSFICPKKSLPIPRSHDVLICFPPVASLF